MMGAIEKHIYSYEVECEKHTFLTRQLCVSGLRNEAVSKAVAICWTFKYTQRARAQTENEQTRGII